MEKKFKETSIPEILSRELAKHSLILGPTHMANVIDALFYGITSRMAQLRNTAVPKAIKFTNTDGSFLAAAKVEFIPNGDDPSSGRFDYVWTFYPEDIEGAEVIDANGDSLLIAAFTTTSASRYHMRFASPETTLLMVIKSIECILSWLGDNVTDTEAATVILEGTFTASAEVNDGKIEYGLVPAGEMKVLIKDDASIQEA